MIATIIVAFATIPQTVNANELDDMPVYLNVSISANVPDGFTQEIAFSLVNEMDVRISALLSTDNNYTATIMVMSDSTYIPEVVFKSGGEYSTNLAEQYHTERENIEITFTVSDPYVRYQAMYHKVILQKILTVRRSR